MNTKTVGIIAARFLAVAFFLLGSPLAADQNEVRDEEALRERFDAAAANPQNPQAPVNLPVQTGIDGKSRHLRKHLLERRKPLSPVEGID